MLFSTLLSVKTAHKRNHLPLLQSRGFKIPRLECVRLTQIKVRRIQDLALDSDRPFSIYDYNIVTDLKGNFAVAACAAVVVGWKKSPWKYKYDSDSKKYD